jgi:formate hydrogenlyase subunit 4
MTLLIGLVAQLLHIALFAVAAPTMVGVQRWMHARLTGRAGSSPLQPWRDLLRLLRKQTVLAECSSGVTDLAPPVAVAAITVVACLVPSFTLGMTLARFGDLLAIAALLVLARCALALAAMDAGTAPGGMAASRAMLLGSVAEPALLLILFALALLAGSLNLDLVAASQIESGTGWRTSIGLACAATLLLAFVDATRHEPISFDFSGPHLALIKAARAMRLLVWFNLIGAAFLPWGMAQTGEGPIAWVVGIAAWLARTLSFIGVLALLQVVLGHIRLQRAAQLLGIAVLLGLLAAGFLFADMGAV